MHRLLSLFSIGLLAACGGSSVATTEPATITTSVTASADVFPARGRERATVVLLHGWNDITPASYQVWIDHLQASGVTVVFPRYQAGMLSSPAAMQAGARQSLQAGFAQAPPTGPIIAAGYSLGGGFAVIYGANAKAWSVPAPDAIYSVFPAMPPATPLPLPGLPQDTTIDFLVGDQDTVVGSGGADQLAAAIAPHPATITTLTSTAAMRFDHLAPKRVDASARAAFWAPLDAIVDRLAAR